MSYDGPKPIEELISFFSNELTKIENQRPIMAMTAHREDVVGWWNWLMQQQRVMNSNSNQ